MTKSILSTCAAFGLVLSTGLSGLCDPPPSPGAPSSSTPAPHLLAPLSLVGVCIGTVVGTPICFFRYWQREERNGTHGLIGSLVNNENNRALLLPAAIMSLPAATIIASLEAPVYGFKNAYMANRPFSKEQFSLGKLEDPKNDLATP